jgi:hypothetical protein
MLNLNFLLGVPLLFISLFVMFLGVRPLTEDEYLYLRLCKLVKFAFALSS